MIIYSAVSEHLNENLKKKTLFIIPFSALCEI